MDEFDFHSVKTIDLRKQQEITRGTTNKKIIQYIDLMEKFGKNSKEVKIFFENNKFDNIFLTKANTVRKLFRV